MRLFFVLAGALSLEGSAYAKSIMEFEFLDTAQTICMQRKYKLHHGHKGSLKSSHVVDPVFCRHLKVQAPICVQPAICPMPVLPVPVVPMPMAPFPDPNMLVHQAYDWWTWQQQYPAPIPY